MQFREIFTVTPIHYDTDRPCSISPETHYDKSFVILKISPHVVTKDREGNKILGEVTEEYMGRLELCEKCYAQMLYNMTKSLRDLEDLKRA